MSSDRTNGLSIHLIEQTGDQGGVNLSVSFSPEGHLFSFSFACSFSNRDQRQISCKGGGGEGGFGFGGASSPRP